MPQCAARCAAVARGFHRDSELTSNARTDANAREMREYVTRRSALSLVICALASALHCQHSAFAVSRVQKLDSHVSSRGALRADSHPRERHVRTKSSSRDRETVLSESRSAARVTRTRARVPLKACARNWHSGAEHGLADRIFIRLVHHNVR
eukprot:ctg_497.g153